MGKFSLFFKFFQVSSKSRKILKPIFPDNLVMLMLFPRFDKLSTTKNTYATFFLVGGSIFLKENQTYRHHFCKL